MEQPGHTPPPQSAARDALVKPPRLHVKNTFLDVSEDSDSSLEVDGSFARASTEPAKVMTAVRRPSSGPVGESGDEVGGEARSEGPGPQRHPGAGTALREPQYVQSGSPPASAAGNYYGNPQHAYSAASASSTERPAGAAAPPEPQQFAAPLDLGAPQLHSSLRALEHDPELAPIFESLKTGGAEAALRHYRDEELMLKLSRKVTELRLAQPSAKEASSAAELSNITRALSGMEERLVRRATLDSIQKMSCSVTLADPGLPDCPLIGCSEGFEALTGYDRREVLGQNCRFLNRGCNVEPNMRQALRNAVDSGREFIGVLPNVKKSGQSFFNLLRLTTVHVRGRRFIIAVQADVTNIDIDMSNPVHVEELRNAAALIFAGNVDAWVQMQAREFSIRQPAPPLELLQAHAPRQFDEAQSQFVTLKLDNEGVRPRVGEAKHSKARRSGGKQQAVAAAKASEGSSGARSENSSDAGEEEGELPQRQESSTAASTTGVLKSVGSAGHPDKCNSECIFFFFRNGCKAGADCRFCHEFHRRKNMKKNRRILSRLSAQSGGSVCMSLGDLEGGSTAGGRAPAFTGSDEHPALASLPQLEAAEVVRFRYGEQGPQDKQQQMALLVGQRVHLPAQVEISKERRRLLQNCLSFAVEPALPRGLVLNRENGVISGRPEVAQGPSSHVATISTEATGPCGIALGQVPLANCKFSIEVVDLQRYVLCSGRSSEQGGRLYLQLEPSP